MRKASSEKATWTRGATVDGARSVGESSAVNGARTASRSRIGAQGAEVARHTAEQSRQRVVEGIDLTRERIPWNSVLPDDARTSLLSAVESPRALSKDAKRKITTQAAPALGELFDKGKDSQAQVLSFLRGLLAISEGSALTKS